MGVNPMSDLPVRATSEGAKFVMTLLRHERTALRYGAFGVLEFLFTNCEFQELYLLKNAVFEVYVPGNL